MIPGVGVADGVGRRVGTGLDATCLAAGDAVGTGLGVDDGLLVAAALGVGEDVRVGLAVKVALGVADGVDPAADVPPELVVAVLPGREVAVLPDLAVAVLLGLDVAVLSGLDVAVRTVCVLEARVGVGAVVASAAVSVEYAA